MEAVETAQDATARRFATALEQLHNLGQRVDLIQEALERFRRVRQLASYVCVGFHVLNTVPIIGNVSGAWVRLRLGPPKFVEALGALHSRTRAAAVGCTPIGSAVSCPLC